MIQIPRIIAHRGSPKAAPENTLASFRQAARDGAAWVEFDVVLTADGRPVIFHDDALDRTTDGAGLIADTPFDVLRNLDAGAWFSRAFAGELIPTLEEALELFAELGLGFNMEIKPAAGREQETAEVALATARASWNGPVPLISSFSRIAVATAKEVQPGWPRGILFDHIAEDWREAADKLEVVSIGANHRHLSREIVAAVHASARKVTAYTVNDAARASLLFSWGVDALFSDIPGTLLKTFP
ncbi:MAG: glycerophosphodiester phosphodiesterase [Rhodospirillaceae bacterium]|nr:glycerophosphodiester phosphodiesterase [Rhodospirillaceae bacterium]